MSESAGRAGQQHGLSREIERIIQRHFPSPHRQEQTGGRTAAADRQSTPLSISIRSSQIRD
jgi:hypothetical protein